MHVLMVFLDGVGLGRKDPEVNPFFRAKLPTLQGLCDGEFPSLARRSIETANATVLPLDATLGVPGLPQSGTGQTALFTGENGARIIGKHFGPHPYSTLRPIVEERNILRRLREAGLQVRFANAFPQRFFDFARQRRSRLTVTTLSCLAGGIPIMRYEDLLAGEGISADITNAGWRSLGHPPPPVVTPREAGRTLGRLTRTFDFVLFEYWKTDHAGHAQDMTEATDVLERLDGLLSGVLDEIDLQTTLVCMTSDHGNLEELSTKTHTRNPVPAILIGHRHRDVAALLRGAENRDPDLTDVTPALMHLFAR
jgi:hypothetical protein